MRCAAGIFFVLFDRSVLEVNKKMDVFRHSLSLIYIMSECTGDCILLFIASIVIMQSLWGIFGGSCPKLWTNIFAIKTKYILCHLHGTNRPWEACSATHDFV